MTMSDAGRRLGSLLLIALFGAALPGPGARGEPYEIHVIEPLTGNSSFVGNGQKQMLQIAIETINRQGGINGQPLALTFHDDQTKPQLTVQIFNEIGGSKPVVVLGMGAVAACNAVSPLAASGPVVYCFTPGARPPQGSYVFVSTVDTLGMLKAAVRYFRLKGWTRFALITSSDATGSEIDTAIDAVVKLPENSAMRLAERSHFTIGDVTISAQIERIKAAQPQAMIAWTTGASVGTIFKAMRQTDLDIPVVTGSGNHSFPAMAQFADILPRQLLIASTLVPQHDGLFQLDPRVEQAQHEMYDALRAHDLKPDNMSAITWDVAYIVAGGLRTLGTGATPAALHSYIEGLSDFAGVNGVYDFRRVPQRGIADENAILVRYDPDAKNWVWMSKPGGEPLLP
jgi:branched-chain amino acid transport system substrate-binding protein